MFYAYCLICFGQSNLIGWGRATAEGGLVLLEDNIAFDFLFHSKLIHHTGNTMLVRIYSMIENLMHELMYKLMSYEDIVNEARTAHLGIVKALQSGDPIEAEQAMGKHLSCVDEFSKERI